LVSVTRGAAKLAIVLVGLPARGKTYTGRKLLRYLTWLGHRTRIFNVGEYRRARLGVWQPQNFYDPDNAEAVELREELAAAALVDMVDWLREEGEVAIYDATNSTRTRRDMLRAACEREDVDQLFVEMIGDDEELVERNIRRTKLKLFEYAGLDPEEAVSDFRQRIAHYARVYENVEPDEGSFVRLGADRQVSANDISGAMAKRVLRFLCKVRPVAPSVWLTRHGETVANISGQIGGNPALAPRGERYALALRSFVDRELEIDQEIVVWTSALVRASRTGELLGRPWTVWPELNEIDAGVCEGMSYEEIRTAMPDEFTARKRDKFAYRYPRGESYGDLIRRVEPVVVEVEDQTAPVLIVAHQAVLRVLYAYFKDIPREQCPHLTVPQHTVVRLEPRGDDYVERHDPLVPTMG